MKYTITHFREEFPNDDTCLDYIFKARFPKKQGYSRIVKRKCYTNSKGHQIYPLKGTIFEGSTTPLHLWFYAMYLFSQSKNGVSGKELQRQLGVTYKCAWRMGHKIRSLMKQGGMLSGVVEIDESYIGGKSQRPGRGTKKQAIFGAVERNGRARVFSIPNVNSYTLTKAVRDTVKEWDTVVSDDYISYKWLKRSYNHYRIDHSEGYYSYKEYGFRVHTNQIEGLWSHIKRSIKGTHIYVSKIYLQSYLDCLVFQYNHRKSTRPLLHVLLERL